MKDFNHISREITKGKNLALNLDKYAASMASLYNGLAYIKLSMNYCVMYEMQQEDPVCDAQFETLLTRFNEMIGCALKETAVQAEEVEALRNDIIKVMEVITAYVDRLRIYEYVLNRIEYRFREEAPDRSYYDNYLTNDLMHYILSDKDNVVIHSKISEVVEQLPMRLSRAKFYEYLREAFTLYHGAQQGTIDDFAYTLRTTAMAAVPDGFETLFPEMYDIINTLANADYTNLDASEFQRLSDALAIGSQKMKNYADLFVMLAQNVNDFYTIILTQSHALENVSEIAQARQAINAVYAGWHKNVSDIMDEVQHVFETFEGRQERILSVISQNDYAAAYAYANYKEQLEELGLLTVYSSLSKAEKLQSGSDFAPLRTDAAKETIPEDAYADEVCKHLIETLDAQFQQLAQPVRRAVMAAVLAQLPVFFNNTEEIQQYINVSLMQCTDPAEQAAVIEVLKMIIRESL